MHPGPERTGKTYPLTRPYFPDGAVDAVREVIESGWIIQGKQVEQLEDSVSQWHESPYAVAVSSATAGLHLAYIAMGIKSGAPCFIPSFAWPSAANMAVQSGLTPVFTDVDPLTYNFNVDLLDLAIQGYIDRHHGDIAGGYVVAIHEFGMPAPMEEIVLLCQKYGLRIIEDAACAFGSRHLDLPVGSSGECAVFSFHPRKSITTGEGGCIITADENLADELKALRNHGQMIHRDGTRSFSCAGFNYRMTDIQAALGNAQILHYNEILEKRRELASYYLESLSDVKGITCPEYHPFHSWQTFMIVLDSHYNRFQIMDRLKHNNISCGPGSVAAHELEFFARSMQIQKDAFPISSHLYHQGLALPLFHSLEKSDISFICQSLKNALNAV